jgi:3-(3-hydroxy-phenyl)propionate hydroxylase
MFDAIIVGLGPTGATMANLLGRRGWNVAVIERSAEIYDKPRAITADHEVMRVFQQIGLADEIVPTTVPHPGTDFLGASGQLIKKFYPAGPPALLSWEPSFMFLQPRLEATLRKGLERFPNVDLLLPLQATTIAVEADHVRVQAQNPDTDDVQTLSGRYLLGCDGASSTVRRAIRATFDDLQFDEEWLVLDAIVDDVASLPARCIQYCRPERPGTYIVGPGNLRRWEIKLLPGEGSSDYDNPASVQHVLRQFTDARSLELVRHAVYRFHAVVADSWRHERVFLLGDAAHQTPPFLGQGMCAGIRDTVNLAWKLDAVHRLGAPNSLLDTYEAERKPHVREIVEHAKTFGTIIGELDVDAARARDRKLIRELEQGTAETVRQNFIPPLRGGAIAVDHSGKPLAGSGELFPQPNVMTASGDVMLLDDLLPDIFVLVSFEDADWIGSLPLPHTPSLSHTRFEVRSSQTEGAGLQTGREVLIDVTGTLSAWRVERDASVAVVRPDKYVYGTAANASELAEILRQLESDLGAVPVASDWIRRRRDRGGVATATYRVTTWHEEALPGSSGDRGLSRARVHRTYAGDLTGAGDLEALICSADRAGMRGLERSSEVESGYVGQEIITATLGGRTGSFVVQHGGIQDGTQADCFGRIVPGSATGQLQGLRGTVTHPPGGRDNPSVRIQYHFIESAIRDQQPTTYANKHQERTVHHASR